MKIIKNILAWIAIVFLGIVYMIDRVVLILLPWIEIKSIQDWMPKNTDLEQIQKEFPTMSEETIFTIKYTRLEAMRLTKVSFTRVAISVFIAMVVYVIFM